MTRQADNDCAQEALRRAIREERRARTRERMEALALDAEAMELGRLMANLGWDDAAEQSAEANQEMAKGD